MDQDPDEPRRLERASERRFSLARQVERLFGVPVLAVIPDVGAAGKGYGLRGRYGYGYGHGYGYGEKPAKSRGRKPGKGGNGEPTQIEVIREGRPVTLEITPRSDLR